MKELLIYVVQGLVNNPDAVSVKEVEREDGEIVFRQRFNRDYI